MSYTCSFDGTDLSGATYSAKVSAEFQPPWHGALKVDVQEAPHGPGASYGATAGPIRFTLPVRVAGSSLSDLNTKLDALKSLFHFRKGEKALVLPQYTGRYWLARVEGQTEQRIVGTDRAYLRIPIVISDPYAYASGSATTGNQAIDTNPEAVTITPGGTWYTSPEWKIRNTTGSAKTDIGLNNTSTGEYLLWRGSLSNNNYLKIDAAAFTVETSADDVTYADAIASCSPTYNRFPRLQDGVGNALSVTGLTAGTISWTYRLRYY